MALDYTKQSAVYANVFNGGYAVKGESGYGTPVDLKFLKAVPLNAQVGSEAIYANGYRITTVFADDGYTGDIGTTAPDRTLEAAIGHLIEAGTGVNMTADVVSSIPVAFYFEHNEKTESGIQYTVKSWLLNVQLGKASRTHSTNTNTPSIGEYAYPAIVSGEKVQNSAGTANYTDEYGNERTCYIISAFPNSTNYATFGSAVPDIKVNF